MFPSAAPSTEAFTGNSPLNVGTVVAAWMRRVGKGTGSPFCQPPVNASERRIQAAVGWAFFWLLIFEQLKIHLIPMTLGNLRRLTSN